MPSSYKCWIKQTRTEHGQCVKSEALLKGNRQALCFRYLWKVLELLFTNTWNFSPLVFERKNKCIIIRVHSSVRIWAAINSTINALKIPERKLIHLYNWKLTKQNKFNTCMFTVFYNTCRISPCICRNGAQGASCLSQNSGTELILGFYWARMLRKSSSYI